jgi:hypothetical protein
VGCNRLVELHQKLANKKQKFSSKRDAKVLDGIAGQLATAQLADAASIANALDKAKAGKSRRRAVDNAYNWCYSQGAFKATLLTVPPRVDVVDTDVIQIGGSSEPGALIVAVVSGIENQRVTADGNGAFTLNIANVPLDQDIAVRISANLGPRPTGLGTTTVKRTISEGAFKAQAQSPPYGELVKGGLQGQTVTYRTKVFQFDTATGPTAFLGYVHSGPVRHME